MSFLKVNTKMQQSHVFFSKMFTFHQIMVKSEEVFRFMGRLNILEHAFGGCKTA